MTAFEEKTIGMIQKQKVIPILSMMTARDKKSNDGETCSHTPAMFIAKKLSVYKVS
jgi:hypothetical protein